MNDDLASGMTKEARELLSWRYERAKLITRIEQLENENMDLRERNDGGPIAVLSALFGMVFGILFTGWMLI